MLPLQLQSHPRTQLDILDTSCTNFASASLLPQNSEPLQGAKKLRAKSVSLLASSDIPPIRDTTQRTEASTRPKLSTTNCNVFQRHLTKRSVPWHMLASLATTSSGCGSTPCNNACRRLR